MPQLTLSLFRRVEPLGLPEELLRVVEPLLPDAALGQLGASLGLVLVAVHRRLRQLASSSSLPTAAAAATASWPAFSHILDIGQNRQNREWPPRVPCPVTWRRRIVNNPIVAAPLCRYISRYLITLIHSRFAVLFYLGGGGDSIGSRTWTLDDSTLHYTYSAAAALPLQI